MLLTGHAQVRAVLDDPRFDVPDAPPGTHGLQWLRGAVSRFSRGQVHARRRGLAAAALATITPGELRAGAAKLAESTAWQARDVPLVVLAGALKLPRPMLEQVALVTSGYFGRDGVAERSDVDDAVEELVEASGGTHDEQTAAWIGLLVQAHEATGALVLNTLAAIARWGPADSVALVVAETLRHDPPVPVIRRECLVEHEVAAGTTIVLDLVAANRDRAVFADPDRFDPSRGHLDQVLTFGAGQRPCPGRDHALALATGAVEGALHRSCALTTVDGEPA